MNRIGLDNRIAVVTGGAQGVGRAIADYRPEEWRRMMASGLDGVFHCLAAPAAWPCAADDGSTTGGEFGIAGGRGSH